MVRQLLGAPASLASPSMPAVVAFAVFAVVSAALAVGDVRRRRLPDRVMLPATIVAVLLLAVAAARTGCPSRAAEVALGAAAAFGVCLLVRLARPEAFGGGDVKLAALVGAHLGWFGPEAVASGVALGFVAAGVAGVGVLAAGGRGSDLPFAPFLLLGAWVQVLVESG